LPIYSRVILSTAGLHPVFNTTEEPELALGVDKWDGLERVVFTGLGIDDYSLVLAEGVSTASKFKMVWHL